MSMLSTVMAEGFAAFGLQVAVMLTVLASGSLRAEDEPAAWGGQRALAPRLRHHRRRPPRRLAAGDPRPPDPQQHQRLRRDRHQRRRPGREPRLLPLLPRRVQPRGAADLRGRRGARRQRPREGDRPPGHGRPGDLPRRAPGGRAGLLRALPSGGRLRPRLAEPLRPDPRPGRDAAGAFRLPGRDGPGGRDHHLRVGPGAHRRFPRGSGRAASGDGPRLRRGRRRPGLGDRHRRLDLLDPADRQVLRRRPHRRAGAGPRQRRPRTGDGAGRGRVRGGPGRRLVRALAGRAQGDGRSHRCPGPLFRSRPGGFVRDPGGRPRLPHAGSGAPHRRRCSPGPRGGPGGPGDPLPRGRGRVPGRRRRRGPPLRDDRRGPGHLQPRGYGAARPGHLRPAAGADPSRHHPRGRPRPHPGRRRGPLGPGSAPIHHLLRGPRRGHVGRAPARRDHGRLHLRRRRQVSRPPGRGGLRSARRGDRHRTPHPGDLRHGRGRGHREGPAGGPSRSRFGADPCARRLAGRQHPAAPGGQHLRGRQRRRARDRPAAHRARGRRQRPRRPGPRPGRDRRRLCGLLRRLAPGPALPRQRRGSERPQRVRPDAPGRHRPRGIPRAGEHHPHSGPGGPDRGRGPPRPGPSRPAAPRAPPRGRPRRGPGPRQRHDPPPARAGRAGDAAARGGRRLRRRDRPVAAGPGRRRERPGHNGPDAPAASRAPGLRPGPARGGPGVPGAALRAGLRRPDRRRGPGRRRAGGGDPRGRPGVGRRRRPGRVDAAGCRRGQGARRDRGNPARRRGSLRPERGGHAPRGPLRPRRPPGAGPLRHGERGTGVPPRRALGVPRHPRPDHPRRLGLPGRRRRHRHRQVAAAGGGLVLCPPPLLGPRLPPALGGRHPVEPHRLRHPLPPVGPRGGHLGRGPHDGPRQRRAGDPDARPRPQAHRLHGEPRLDRLQRLRGPHAGADRRRADLERGAHAGADPGIDAPRPARRRAGARGLVAHGRAPALGGRIPPRQPRAAGGRGPRAGGRSPRRRSPRAVAGPVAAAAGGARQGQGRRRGAAGAGRRPHRLRRPPVGDHRRRPSRRLALRHAGLPGARDHRRLRVHRPDRHGPRLQPRLQPLLPGRVQPGGAARLRRHRGAGRPRPRDPPKRAVHRRRRDLPRRPPGHGAVLLQPGPARGQLSSGRQPAGQLLRLGHGVAGWTRGGRDRLRARRRRERVRVVAAGARGHAGGRGPSRPGPHPALRRGRRRQRRAGRHLVLDRLGPGPAQEPVRAHGPADPGRARAGDPGGAGPLLRRARGRRPPRAVARRHAGAGGRDRRQRPGAALAAPGALHPRRRSPRIRVLPAPGGGPRRRLGAGDRAPRGPGHAVPRGRRRATRRRRQRGAIPSGRSRRP